MFSRCCGTEVRGWWIRLVGLVDKTGRGGG